MRVSSIRLALVVFSAVCPPLTSPAQSTVHTYVNGQTAGPSNLPYIAIQKTTDVQVLADGNTITRTSETKEARDSQGRTMHQHALQEPSGGGPRYLTDVLDPVNHTNLHWDSTSKQGFLFHMNQPVQTSSASHSTGTTQQETAPKPPAPCRDVPGFEELGTETIAGVSATGTRRTRVIPEGKEGNSKPLTIVDETWTSPELRLTVRQIHDDPRTGRHTLEVTELDRGEPDPALFQPPADYTIKDQNPVSQ